MQKLVPELFVEDVAETTAFYERVLGFQLVGATSRAGRWRAGLCCGAVEIAFRSLEEDQTAGTPPLLHFFVDNIVTLYRRVLLDPQARVLRPLEPTLFGAGEFVVEAPGAMVLRFTEPHLVLERPPTEPTSLSGA